MIVYRLDVDRFEYELMESDAAPHEEYTKKRGSVSNAVIVLVTVERGDTDAIADQAINDIIGFMSKVKEPRLLIYPFTLSMDPAGPKEAIALMDRMCNAVPDGMQAERVPYGWIARVSMSIKGHNNAQCLLTYAAARETVHPGPIPPKTEQRHEHGQKSG